MSCIYLRFQPVCHVDGYLLLNLFISPSVRVRGTGSADPQQKLIFCRFLIFCTAYVGFVLKHLLFVHATEYGVINAGG